MSSPHDAEDEMKVTPSSQAPVRRKMPAQQREKTEAGNVVADAVDGLPEVESEQTWLDDATQRHGGEDDAEETAQRGFEPRVAPQHGGNHKPGGNLPGEPCRCGPRDAAAGLDARVLSKIDDRHGDRHGAERSQQDPAGHAEGDGEPPSALEAAAGHR